MDKETLKNLLYKNESVADLAPETMAQADAFCEGYKKFLDNGKTEREACAYSEGLLKAAGYRPFVPGEALRPGDKIYWINRKKVRAGRYHRQKEHGGGLPPEHCPH